MQLTTDKKIRKEMPIARGLLDYFPNALAEVAHVSFIGNQQHNPGEEMRWAREKSKDHADCVARHLIERGTIDDDGLRHSAKLAWRALALLQLEIEQAERNAKHGDDFAAIRAIKLVSSVPQDSAWQPDRNADAVARAEAGEFDHTPDLAEHTHKPVHLGMVYISGPMRGKPDHNFPAFDEAKAKLQSLGYEVISPADMDRGDDRSVNYTQEYYAKRDIDAINRCTHVAVLPGWFSSQGATAEVYYARWVGKKFLDHLGQKFCWDSGDFVTNINLGAK